MLGGATTLRLRPGAATSAETFVASLGQAFPLAQTRLHRNVLDGSMEAHVCVPEAHDAEDRARQLAKRNPLLRVLLLSAYLMALLAFLLAICT